VKGVTMDDLISRQDAIKAHGLLEKDCNPDHFIAHDKFIGFMDDAEISSFGDWQFANGFNLALMASKVAIKELPSAQTEIVRCKDCRWYDGDYCQKHGDDWGGEWFCADAELMRKGKWMDDFISRKTAVQGVRELFSLGDCYCDEFSIVGMLNQLQSAQPERTKGKWVIIKPLGEMEPKGYMCSNCRNGDWDIDIERYKFCPYCGAEICGVEIESGEDDE